MRLLRVQERRAKSTSLENVFFFICSRPRRPRVLCHGTDWTGPAPCDCHTALFALHLHQGGGRIRAFCDLQAWTAEKRWVEKSHNGSKFNRLLKSTGGAKGPGIFFIIPCTDSYQKVDLRTVSFDVPPQEVLSRDSVTVSVDAVVYYRVSNPTMATNNIEDYRSA